MNMYPLNEEILRRDYALNREPDVKARNEQRRLLAEAGLVRRSRFSCRLCQQVRLLGREILTSGLRILTRRLQTE
jgi:hypothetical protein